MKQTCVSFILLCSMASFSGQTHEQDDFPVLKGPYLGQTPPGQTAEPFAPGIVSTEHYEVSGVFTPDLNEFYVIKDGGKYDKSSFVRYQNTDTGWQESVISRRVGTPTFSPDGITMHLGKRFTTRTADGWSKIQRLGSPFEEIRIMRLSSSLNGTYVFDEVGNDGDGIIRYSRIVDGKREDPKPFGKEINDGTWNAHPFIAPDESYLIFDAKRDEGFGDSDLYISYRQKDGSWGKAINLGDKINTDAWEAVATVTPDGKYLIFNRNVGSDDYLNVDVLWVDAQFIETLRPKP